PKGPNAPAAPAPPEIVRQGPAAPAPAEPQSKDPSLALRQTILDRAAAMLSTPYVWGGNTVGRGMDCSAYVSAAWGVARYTTESIGWVSFPIAKEELRSGRHEHADRSRPRGLRAHPALRGLGERGPHPRLGL